MKIIFLRNKYTMILFKLLIKILPMKFSINLKKGFDQDYFKLHKYNSDNEYIAKQIKKTSDKLNRGWHGAWTNEQTISKLSNYLQKSNKKIGICHGKIYSQIHHLRFLLNLPCLLVQYEAIHIL